MGLAVQKHTLVSRVSLLARLFFTTTFLQGLTLVARVHPGCKGPPWLQGFMISNEIPDCCFQTLVSRSSPLLQGSTLVARVHPPDCCFRTLVSRVNLLAKLFVAPTFFLLFTLVARVHSWCFVLWPFLQGLAASFPVSLVARDASLIARDCLSPAGPFRRGFGRSSVGQVLELLDGVL